tara:strand:- start:244 stop:426 length:183 start_codon:yes stop_codon:yes gene_type:complete
MSNIEEATMEEWGKFLSEDKFYTAPEFLLQKFFLKTGKTPPSSVISKWKSFEGKALEGEE